MSNNYLFVDGSALLADVKRITSEDPYRGRRLDVTAFAAHFTQAQMAQYHGQTYRRFTIYFVVDDTRPQRDLILPEPTIPGAVSDLRVEWCGKSIKEFRKAQEWLDAHNAPPHVRECLYRSEKAVDTQICADALQLAAVGRLERLFLYTNDYDFVPLCRTLRQLGINVNLFRLRAETVNADLARECDGFDVAQERALQQQLFLPVPPPHPAQPLPEAGSAPPAPPESA